MNKVLLNPEQQLAVNYNQGPLLVLAGAGSGKTRVIIHHITNLINHGVRAKQIVAVTFTNKAAAEMRERISAQTEQSPLICTFHSLGVRILRESIEHMGFSKNFVIYDEEDALKMLRTCIKELQVEDKTITPKALKQIISKAKNRLEEPQEDSSSSIGQIAPKVFKLYQAKLFEASAVDFDDLLFLPVKLFKEFPNVLEVYQNRWHHLLVDEYQDTNHAQYTLASQLVAKHRNFFVVGDPDQSIYTWRGANIQNILNFEKDWSDAQIVRLEQNYRSTSTILEAANHLIENNENRFKKDLWSNLGEGEKIYKFNAYNEREEADFIVDTLTKNKQKFQIDLKDMVIFYRTNAQSRPFEDELLRRNIPYSVVGGMSFYQRREIKDVLAFLKLINNPSDTVSFLRTINLPKRGFGEASLAKILHFANRSQYNLIDACQKLLDPGAPVRLNQKQQRGLTDYINLLSSLKKISHESPLNELVYQAIQKSGYLESLKLDPDSFDDRKANIDELVAKAIDWEDQNPDGTLAQFLEELTLNTSQTNEDARDRLVLMSVHNGKGLEFHSVFLTGMEESLFPHINSFNTHNGIEEERRLCYVGMTRAKRILYLTRTMSRFIWGGARSMRPSRFLKEIPSKYCQRVDEDDEYQDSFAQQQAPVCDEKSEFSLGDVVYHQEFGVGKVQNIKSSSLGVTYDVNFQKDGSTKTLLAKFAKLSAI
ncbi:MAG: ATP-dependent DNA helicase PcrA [Chlamydiae bacterium]|nr:ATP-dependent DNA helicase PcrA [Chlamydiota bacterium]